MIKVSKIYEMDFFHVVERASALLNKETENFNVKKGNSVFLVSRKIIT